MCERERERHVTLGCVQQAQLEVLIELIPAPVTADGPRPALWSTIMPVFTRHWMYELQPTGHRQKNSLY